MDKGHHEETKSAHAELEPEQSGERVQGYLAEASAAPDTPSDGTILDAAAYIARIQREIEAEVAALRAAGKYPPSLVARIKRYYQTLLPVGSATSTKDFDEAYRLLDRVAYIDIDVPTRSQKPGVSQIKRLLRMCIAWYLNYVAQQFNNFSSNLIRLIGIIDARISRLETKFAESEFTPLELLGSSASVAVQSALAEAIVQELEGTTGRILVAECADGTLLSKFVQTGHNAYGIDTRVVYLDRLEAESLEVRNASTLAHLAKVADSSLAGLVLSGIVDRASVSDRVASMFHAKRVLCQGGTLAIVGAGLGAFMAPKNHLESDLSPGRPLSPQTWSELARQLSFSHVRTLNESNSDGFVVFATNTKIDADVGSLGESGVISGALHPRPEK